MSKSPNILLPALGGAALVMGIAAGVGSRNYGENRIETLEARVAQVSAQAESAGTKAAAEAERAVAEAARASELEQKIAEIQQAAAARADTGGSLTAPAPAADGSYGLGRAALPEEIAAWDVDVLPDGRGLPEGSGDVLTGEEVFADACASCHGDFAEGVDNWPVLAGGFDTLADKDPVKTVGSYWPYLSTVWDYVHRSMPFGAAQTLTTDEVYAITAYILYSNDLVDEDFELSHENFADFTMYNADGFVVDDRAEQEYAEWRTDPCMENCKDSVKITMRASVLDVTPEESMEEAMSTVEHGEATEAAAAEPEPEAPADTTVAAIDPALVEEGEKVFRNCKSCHQIGEGAKNRSGPLLTGVMGRGFGQVDGFKYSNAFQAAAEEGRTWTADEMAAFLADPKGYVSGTKMSFRGLKSDEDIDAMIAYLSSFEG